MFVRLIRNKPYTPEIMRKYIRKTDRPSWSETAMAAAIKTCISGSVGYMKASKIFNVPRSTLKDRIKRAKSGKSIVEAAGKVVGRYNTVFTAKQEEELKLHVIEMESKLFELRQSDLRKLAYQFAERINVKHHFNRQTHRAGFDWLQGFISRHPDISFFISKANKTAKWSEDSIALLIDLYKKNPCLYDSQSEFYLDKQEQNNTTLSIARQLQEIRPGTTNSEVHTKIESLRAAYLYVRRKIAYSLNGGSSINEEYIPNLWYYDKLSFLADYVMPFKYMENLMESEISTSAQGTIYIEFSEIKTEQDNSEESPLNTDTSSEASNPLVFTQLDSPYLIQLNNQLAPSPVPLLEHHSKQYLMPITKRAIENDPLGIPPADGLNSYEGVSTTAPIVARDSIDHFISYISARMRRIKRRDILQELEDDILLKVMQAEKDDRN